MNTVQLCNTDNCSAVQHRSLFSCATPITVQLCNADHCSAL